tara:strand:- start:28791 stop:29363 length:573 start_codon:yes stop_codon:yes gene_type:complete
MYVKRFDKDFVKQLYNEIPKHILDKYELKSNSDSGVFRFNKEELESVYLSLKTEHAQYYAAKYSYPDFKFQFIYIRDSHAAPNGDSVEWRYNADLEKDGKYIKQPSLASEGIAYRKILDKGKKVDTIYRWGDLPNPIQNLQVLKPYIECKDFIHTDYRWMHKDTDPSIRYIVWHPLLSHYNHPHKKNTKD